jgi:hypothetical protein
MRGLPLSTIPFADIKPEGIVLSYYKGPALPAVDPDPATADAEDVALLQEQKGSEALDWVINNSPWEMHITDQGDDRRVRKAEFCGPATHLAKRLELGHQDINELDRACKQHDIWYRDHRTAKERHPSDLKLAEIAARIAQNPNKPEMQRKKAKMVAAVLSGKAFLGLGSQEAAFRYLLAGIGKKLMQRGGRTIPALEDGFHLVPKDGPSAINGSSNGDLINTVAKLIGTGLDKLIDYSISRKKKKAEVQQKKLSQAEIRKIQDMMTNLKKERQKAHIAIKSKDTIDLSELWPGTNIKLYKSNGVKKTRKELEDELYLGIKPQEGGRSKKKRK